MFRTYLADHKISIYKLSQLSGIPYSTLNDLANYKLPVENLRSGQLKALSDALEMTMDHLYQLCTYKLEITSQKYQTTAEVVVRQKHYHLLFERNGKKYDDDIIPVKQEATQYIDILAEWKLEEHLAMLVMEEAYESVYLKTKR